MSPLLSLPIPASLGERLGWTLFHFLWQGAALALVWLLAKWWLRRAQASTRYSVARGLFSLLALAPLGTFVLVRAPFIDRGPDQLASVPAQAAAFSAPAASIVPTAAQKSAILPVVAPAPAKAKSAKGPVPWTWNRIQAGLRRRMPLLAAGWCAGVLLLSLRHLAGWWQLRRWKRVGVRPVPGPVEKMGRELATRMGLRRAVAFLESTRIPGPAALGWLKPVVLLPVSALTGLDEAQLRAILAHELAHLRRWDYAVNWLQTLVETLLFFHPAVWWISRDLRTERELCCDDEVLHAGCDRLTYARALGQLAAWQAAAPALAATGGPLVRRIRRLLAKPEPAAGPGGPIFLACLAALCGLALTAAHLQAAEKEATPADIVRKLFTDKAKSLVKEIRTAAAPTRGRILDRNGLVLAETGTDGLRHYPFNAMAAHAIGYVGKTEKTGLSVTGRSGLEKSLNETLSAGQDVILTLDARLQAAVEETLRTAKISRGAVVVLDPNDGSVLAMASMPNYDLNQFVPRLTPEKFKILEEDRTRPLLNRTTAAYAPGSTFKLTTALALVQEGKGNHYYNCEGAVTYGTKSMKCWCQLKGFNHGTLNLSAAIMNSCNAWFYQAGNEAGMEQIASTASLLGFGARTGIELPDSPGLIPTPAWLAQTHPGEHWSPAYTANSAIGQGFVEVTPLQSTMATAAFGNGGKAWQPHLSSEIATRPVAPVLLHDLVAEGTKTADFELIRKGMWNVVNSATGTGKNAKTAGWEVAGKTGTAQFWRGSEKDNHTWFTSFAPYKNPRYALTVFVQGGEAGGKICAPLTAEMLRRFKEIEAGGTPAPGPQPEVKGSFAPVDSVPFPGGEKPPEAPPAEDEKKNGQG